MLPLLRLNAERNAAPIAAAGGHASVAPLEWADDERPAEASQGSAPSYDVVLGADLIYNGLSNDGSSAQLRSLSSLLQKLLAPPDGSTGATSPLLLLAHKRRHAEVDHALVDELREAGVALEELPHDVLHPEYRSPSIALFAGRMASRR